MILGDPARVAVPPQGGGRSVTVDDVFRRMVARQPDTLALADAPNRNSFTDGPPRRLTFKEADRAISAIAGRLRAMGLPTDAIIGIQLPNIVENIVTILGVLRAGLIAAPLPLLWGRAEAVTALTRIGAKALITCGRIGKSNYCESAMHIASEVFSIRYVYGYGKNLPDGVVPLDGLLSGAEKLDPIPPFGRERHENAAAHVGLITFDINSDGIVPVARDHLEMLAGGLGVVLECGMARGANILSTIAPSSFSGVCLTLLPWLLKGGTLQLHHPFDLGVLVRQQRVEGCDTLVLPAPIALRLGGTDGFARGNLSCVVAAWRAPEQLASSTVWREKEIKLVDIPIFGEAGLIAVRRDSDGTVAPLPCGPVTAPRGRVDAVTVAELIRTSSGTIGLRGPMVPRHAFPPRVESSELPHLKVGPEGVVDTGYSCRVESSAETVVVTGPPAGIVDAAAPRYSPSALGNVAVRPTDVAAHTVDTSSGPHLNGTDTDHDAVRAAFAVVGVNPIATANLWSNDEYSGSARFRAAAGR